MIGAQAAIIAYMSNTRLVPLGILALAIIGGIWQPGWKLSRRTAFYLIAGLAVAAFGRYWVTPNTFLSRTLAFGTHAAYALAEFQLVVQTAQLYLREPGRPLPTWLVWLGAFTLVLTADILPYNIERHVLQVLVIVFSVAAILFYGLGRNVVFKERSVARTAAIVTVLVSIVVVGWTSAALLYRFEKQLDGLMSRLAGTAQRASGVGFTGRARLGSVSANQANDPAQLALQVFSDEAPGYLRGAAFDTWDSPDWKTSPTLQPLRETDNVPEGIRKPESGRHCFVLRNESSADWQTFEVWPAARSLPTVFAPVGTAVVQAPFSSMSADTHEVLSTQDVFAAATGYSVSKPNVNPRAPNPGYRRQLLALPESLDPRIAQLANGICESARSDADRIRSIENFFHQNFEYRIGIDIPAGSDPLSYFLLERRPAHCEYFATGAAMLLRLAGVPCRFVTGFVATERNEIGNSWIARNKDAHAWVEAWDADRGWVIVEATPPSGRPRPADTSTPWQFWESLRESARVLFTRLQQGEFRAALSSLGRIAVLMAVPTALFAAGYWIIRRWGRIRATIEKRTELSPEQRELHRLLRRIDKAVQKRSLIRAGHETLHQFADRISRAQPGDELIQRAAEWYRLYAMTRYSRTPTHEVSSLRATLDETLRLRARRLS